MSLLSYNQLRALLDGGVLEGSDLAHINAASVDLVLGDVIYVEKATSSWTTVDGIDIPDIPVIDMLAKDASHLEKIVMGSEGYIVPPGGVLLAQTVEVFHLPNWLSGDYKLKSTQARNFFNHLNAGWADAGWNNSVLTLEFVNHNQRHAVRVKPGIKCGQMIFFSHEEVPDHASYSNRGQYNGDRQTTPGKGLR